MLSRSPTRSGAKLTDNYWNPRSGVWSEGEAWLAQWHARRIGDTIERSSVNVTEGGARFDPKPQEWKTKRLDGSYDIDYAFAGGVVSEDRRRRTAQAYIANAHAQAAL